MLHYLGGDINTVCITHREYLTDIFGPAPGVPFNVQSYAVNPALSQSFPFLSQIACNYDEYKFEQLIYSYKSTTTDIGNSTTGQCGTVIQACNYNASAGAFTDKGIMMEYFGAVSCKVTESSQCGIECDSAQNAGANILYTRANPVVTGQDLKTYDLGTYQLAVANSPAAYANLPIGELWVDYTITLRKPKLYVTRGLEIDTDQFFTETAAPVSNTITPLSPFGQSASLILANQQNNIGCSIIPGQQFAYAGTTVPYQNQLALASGGFSVLLPAAFNGNLRVSFEIQGGGFKISNGANGLLPLLLGNIQPIRDVYCAGGNYVPYTSTPAVLYPAYDNSTMGANNLTYYIDMYVRQAFAINYNSGGVVYSAGQILDGQYTGGNNIISFPPLGTGIIDVTPVVNSTNLLTTNVNYLVFPIATAPQGVYVGQKVSGTGLVVGDCVTSIGFNSTQYIVNINANRTVTAGTAVTFTAFLTTSIVTVAQYQPLGGQTG